MRGKISVLGIAMAALVIGVALFAAPSTSDAGPITITDVSVTVGGGAWCGSSPAGCAPNPIWTPGLLPAGIFLAPGDTLVLTQTGAAQFNFDTSEGGGGGQCSAGNPCTTTLFINSVGIPLGAQAASSVLAFFNGDVAGQSLLNEAHEWLRVFVGLDFDVYFGYADNTHTNDCADVGNNNCVPDTGDFNLVWQTNDANNHFIGGGSSAQGLGIVQGGAFHCDVNAATTLCFEGGAILIVAKATPQIPEPSTLVLLGAGLMALAGWGLARNRTRI